MSITGSFSINRESKNNIKKEKKTGIRVLDIIYDRIMQRIEYNKKLPWDKGFSVMSINWATGKAYEGINQFMLMGGEYITINQLNMYNERVKSNIIKAYEKNGLAKDNIKVKNAVNESVYRIKKGSKAEIVVFYSIVKAEIAEDVVQKYRLNERSEQGYSSSEYLREAYVEGIHFALIDTETGVKWHRLSWTLRYYNVFNIIMCMNAKGESLEPKLGRELIYTYDKADKLVKDYRERTGVGVKFEPCSSAYYKEDEDIVVIPPRKYFSTDEGFYRTLFHELAHSTGIAKRLNRSEFLKYRDSKENRSKEEVVAETAAMLLAQDCDFNNADEVSNSDTYVQSWLSWIENNKDDFIYGLMAANRARNYIKGSLKKGDKGIIC